MSQGLYIYVARWGEYDDEQGGSLAFSDMERAKDFINNQHHVLGNSAEYEGDERLVRAEDNVGNWAEIERVRLSDPEGLFDYEQ